MRTVAQLSVAAESSSDLAMLRRWGRADPRLQSTALEVATGTAPPGAALPREGQGDAVPGSSWQHGGALPPSCTRAG